MIRIYEVHVITKYINKIFPFEKECERDGFIALLEENNINYVVLHKFIPEKDNEN